MHLESVLHAYLLNFSFCLFQFYEAVGEMVTLAEIGDYLQCNPDPSIDVTLLGLTQQDIDSCNQHKQAINYFVL